MRNFSLFILLFLSTFFSYSQYIEGTVLDAQTQKPIEGVDVYMEGINRGAVTNEKGNYYIKFPFEIVKKGIIHFSHIVYSELKIPYTQGRKNYSINLLIDLKKLEEVKISEKRNLQKTISYKKLSSMKNGLFSFGSVLENNNIYIVGGNASLQVDGAIKSIENYGDSQLSLLDILEKKARKSINFQSYKGDLLIYNIDEDTWAKDTVKFKKRANNNAIKVNNKLYVLGGKTISTNGIYEYLDDKIEVYDFTTKTLKIDNTNPHQAVNFSSFKYQNNIIVLGGSIKIKNNGFKEYSNKVHLYNTETGLWYEIANMPIAKETNGVLIADKIYLFGGYNKTPLMNVESFDLKTQKWKKEGELFKGLSNPAITTDNNTVYLFENSRIITYNIETKELNEYLIDLNLYSSKLFYRNSTLYIIGGYTQNNYSIVPSANLYSININEFNKTKVYKNKLLQE